MSTIPTITTEYGTVHCGSDWVEVVTDGTTLRRWANRPGYSWPASELAEASRVAAAFDSNGLTEEHPCWFVTVGQFRG